MSAGMATLDAIDKTSEKRPEFVRVREPDYMPGPFDQLESRIGYQVGHLLNRLTRANVSGAVDKQRWYFQPRYRSQQDRQFPPRMA